MVWLPLIIRRRFFNLRHSAFSEKLSFHEQCQHCFTFSLELACVNEMDDGFSGKCYVLHPLSEKFSFHINYSCCTKVRSRSTIFSQQTNLCISFRNSFRLAVSDLPWFQVYNYISAMIMGTFLIYWTKSFNFVWYAYVV